MSYTSNFLKELEKQKAGSITSGTGSNEYTKNFLKGVSSGGLNTVPLGKKKKEDDVIDIFRADRVWDDDDIAPVKDDDEGFFKKSKLFDDGYDIGDVTKTILGSIADFGENALAGIAEIPEIVIDAGAKIAPFFIQGGSAMTGDYQTVEQFEMYQKMAEEAKKKSEEFVKKDLYDGEKVAQQIIHNSYIQNPYAKYTEDINIEDYSVFGEEMDNVAKSSGQYLVQAGLQSVGVPWYLTAGVMAYGSEAENALNQDATSEEADLSGLISAGAEIAGEFIPGGKIAKIFGKTGLDEAITKRIASGISNKVMRALVGLGVDMTSEGAEELFTGAVSAVGQKLTYADGKEYSELFGKEDALKTFLSGAILGGMIGGGSTVYSVSQGVDPVSGLNKNEQAVVDALYKERLAEAEKSGSDKKKSDIYDEILRDMERGYIPVEKVEELLGGDTYKTYRETADAEDAIFKEYEELGNLQNATLAQQERYRELIQQIQEIKTTSKRNELKTKLSDEVMGLVNGSRLAESFNERARRSQTFEADLSQYDAPQQQVIQKAIDSGILNNTNRTHEFVDIIAKISADKGVLFDFTNNERLKESGFAVDGKFVNGYVTKDGITLNIDSPKAWQSTVGREITHVLEGTDLYTELQNVLTEYAKTKGDYQGRYDALVKLYEGVEGANVDAELTADLVGDYLFTDSDFIHKLSTENRNIFQKIYDEIKYLCKVVTAGSKEARELEKVKRAFGKAYRESGKAQGDTKYSLSDSDGRQLSEGQQEYFKDSKVRDENGNLKVMYRGGNGDFTVFDRKKSSYSNLYGRGFYFTESESHAKQYGNARAFYLDIKNPVSTTEQTITRDQMRKFLEAVAENEDDYSFENYGYGATVDSVLRSVYSGKSDFAMLYDVSQTAIGDMVAAVELFNEVNGTDYDGLILDTETVTFRSNQAKLTDNQTPTDDPDIRHSLSLAGKAPRTYGRYNVPATELRLETEQDVAPYPEIGEENLFPDDLAPFANVAEQIERLEEEKATLDDEAVQIYNDFADGKISQEEYESRTTEINEKWNEADREISSLTEWHDSFDDADAPPETEAPYVEPPEAITLTKKAVADIARTVRRTLSLTNRQMAELRGVIEDYSEAQYPDREKLRQYIEDRFGSINESELNEELAEVQSMLRSYKLNVSDTIKSDIADYAPMMRSNFGKIRFSKDGSAVDQAYEELSGMFPGYFPNDITNPTDQFLRIVDVANFDKHIERNYELDDATLNEAVDAIVNGINGFKQTQRQRQAERFDRDSFDDLVRHGDEYAPPAEDDITPVKQTAKQTEAPKPNPRVANVLTESSPEQNEKSGIGKKLVSQIVDKGMVFENLSLETGNKELQAKYNYALPSNTEARAQYLMEHGAEGVKSLKDIMKPVTKGKEKSFFDYLYHVHNIDRMTLEERFETPNKAVFGDTVTADVSRSKVKRYEKSNPEFKEWAKDIYAYNKYLRQMLVDGNVISQETANLWEKMYPHYVPIRRVDDSGLNVNVPLDTNKTGVNAPVKRATGGSGDIEPLFNTMAQRTEQTFRAIARNDFGIELKNTLGTTIGAEQNVAGVDEMIDTIEAQEDHLLKPGTMHSNPTFTVFENGERVEFEITEDMFDALKPAGKILGYRNKPVTTVSNWRRNLLTTWNPVFALYRNPVKDLQEVAINSQHPVKTYASIPKALWQMATDGKYATEYHQSGGKSNTYFDSRKNEFKAEDNIFKKTIGMPIRAIETAGEFIEEIPRLAEYIASRQEGRSIERSMLDAARVTTNFAAGGDFTKFLNAHGFNFLNASMQGASQHVRNFREATKQDGMKGFVKVVAKYTIAGLPGILLNNLLWDDDEEYEELSDYVKQNYYVVAKTKDGKFIRIPKGRTSAVVQYGLEQMQNLITGDDEADFATFYELFMNNIAPSNPVENNILAPIIQTAKNEAWYGGDLVPSRLQDLPAAEQFDESTDSFSKWLGEKIDKSPYKINYLLDQYSGGLGDVFLPMMTPEAESGNDSFVGNLLAPWKKEITTDSVLNNKNPGDFYDLKDELEVISNGKDATEEDAMRSMYMDSVSWAMGDLYQQKREIQNSDLSDAEKYEAVRELQEQINELANNALDSYNDVNITGIYSEVGDRRYNYSEENGRWYEIKPTNADGEDNYFYQQEQKVTNAFGISYAEYWNNKEEYDYAYNKPEQYTLSQVVGGYKAYKGYSSDLWDIKADKDANGKSINGSRKTKVIDYINNLDADYYEKIILFKSEYPADDTYNMEIINYLNSREDVSYKEMETILKELGFEVDSQGNIKW